MSQSELACTYAALILHDDGVEVTADKIEAILKAAKITVEPYWPSLFAKVLAKKDIGDLIANVGAGAPVAVAAGAPAGGAAAGGAPAKEEKAPEPESEEEEMGLDLFG